MISLTVLSLLGVMGIIAKGEKPGGISSLRDLSTETNESAYILDLRKWIEIC